MAGRCPTKWPLNAAAFKRYPIEARAAKYRAKWPIIAQGLQRFSARREALRIQTRNGRFSQRDCVLHPRSEGRAGCQKKRPASHAMDGLRQLKWTGFALRLSSPPRRRWLWGREENGRLLRRGSSVPRKGRTLRMRRLQWPVSPIGFQCSRKVAKQGGETKKNTVTAIGSATPPPTHTHTQQKASIAGRRLEWPVKFGTPRPSLL